MLLLVDLPDEDYKRIVKAPRAVTPNEAFNQRIELLNVIKKAKPVKNKIFYRCDHQIEKCKNSITCGGEVFCRKGKQCSIGGLKNGRYKNY